MVYKTAEKVGEEIAKTGCILICGGLGGVMEACAKGAKKHGGVTVGILPGASKEEANEHIDIKVVTAMGHGRNALLARSGDVLIAVGGGLGTLSEISLGLKMGKSVVVIEGLKGISDLVKSLKVQGLYFAKTPKEAVKLALKLA